MLELRLSLDVERLPEFRQLVANLSARVNPQQVCTPKQVEAAATFLWLRLWIELGYLAQRTNKPGHLAKWGAEEYRRTVGGLFGDETDPLQILSEGPPDITVLRALENGEYFCELFAKTNAHLSGDHLEKHERGNINSAVSRRQERLTKEAVAQGSLFGDDFVNLANEKLVGKEMQSAIVVVRNVDSALGLPVRHTKSYTQGLFHDALRALQKGEPGLIKFYGWLAANRHNSEVQERGGISAEKILASFEEFYALANPK